MSTDQDRDAYLRTLDEAKGTERSVVIIATFAPDVRPRCSGLPVARYSAADLEAALGTRWQMINESRRELRTTPGDTSQPFTWAAFAARPRQASHASCVSSQAGPANPNTLPMRWQRRDPNRHSPLEQRQRDGKLPDAIIIDRKVLEWRLDPTGGT